MAAYQPDIDRLMAEKGFRTVDVISLAPDHPRSDALRAKFLDEHWHSEDEVRFFVAGRACSACIWTIASTKCCASKAT